MPAALADASPSTWRHEMARHRCTVDRDFEYGVWLVAGYLAVQQL